LGNLLPEDTHHDKEYDKARKIAHSFQEGLDNIFFETQKIGLFELTKKYGVF
jgi:hypothetical protein